MHRFSLTLVVVLSVVVVQGCSTRGKPTAEDAMLTRMTGAAGDIKDPAALSGALIALASRRYTDTMGLASRIASASPDSAVREETLRMRLRAVTFVDNLIMIDDPRRAFIYSWLFIEERLFFLKEGEGRDSFGAFQADVVQTLEDVRQATLQIGYEHFGRELIEKAQDDISAMAQRQILNTNQVFADRMPLSSAIAVTANRNSDLRALMNIPMAPVGALQGAANAPVALQDMAMVASSIARVVQNLPERIRWQTELLLYELESLDTIQALREDSRRLSLAAEQLATTTQGLPDEVRKTLEDLEAQQPELRKTLAEARETIALAHETVAALSVLADSANQAATTSRGLMQDIQQLVGETSEPGDTDTIEQLIALADKITTAATELRSLTTDVSEPMREARTLSQESIAQATENTERLLQTATADTQRMLSDATADTRRLLDAAAWRAAGLIVLAFVLMVVYRLLFRARAG